MYCDLFIMDLSLRSIETNNWSVDNFKKQWVVHLRLQYNQVTLVSGCPFWQLSVDHNMDVHKDVHYQVKHRLYTAISRKVVGKNVHVAIPKGNMGYDQYTVPDNCSCRTYFCCFPLALANTFSWPFVPILSYFSEEQWTQNHPQCLPGLLRVLFLTTFLEIAVCLGHLHCS